MGLAVHFRCRQPEVAGLRIDIMTNMRGVATFPELWDRRTTIAFEDETIDVMALPDLVAAKKTQRDKDWPMIRRLVDANYLSYRDEPTPERVVFWLREMRDPDLLVEVARAHADAVEELAKERPLLALATTGNLESGALGRALRDEEEEERRLDAAYWKPLRERIENLRRSRSRSGESSGKKPDG
jgi:hypothetical protein